MQMSARVFNLCERNETAAIHFNQGECSVNKFKSHDHALVATCLNGFKGIEARDAKCANPKPTTALSNRVLIVDPTDTALVAAWALVKGHLVGQTTAKVVASSAFKSPPSIKFKDSFLDQPNNDLSARYADTGETWLRGGGVALTAVGGGVAPYTVGPTTGQISYTANHQGPADGQLDMNFQVPFAVKHGISVGAIFRAGGANNWLVARLEPLGATTSYRLAVWDSLGVAPIASSKSFDLTPGTYYRLSVVLSGANITATLFRGLSLIQDLKTATASKQSQKGVGVWWFCDDGTNHPGCRVTSLTKTS